MAVKPSADVPCRDRSSPALARRCLIAARFTGAGSASHRIAWDDSRPCATSSTPRGISDSRISRLRRPPASDTCRARARRRSRSPDLLHPAVDALHVAARRSSRRSARRRWSTACAERARRRSCEGRHVPAARVLARRPRADRGPAAGDRRRTGTRRATAATSASSSPRRFPSRARRVDRPAAREYLRVMRFVYEKEFVAQRAAAPGRSDRRSLPHRAASARTPRSRPAILVSIGLGMRQVARARAPHPAGADRRSRPRSRAAHGAAGSRAAGKLSAVGGDRRARRRSASSRLDELEVVAADINPRVVAHLRRARATPADADADQRDRRLPTP